METFKNLYSLFSSASRALNPTREDYLFGGKVAANALAARLSSVEGDAVGRMYGAQSSVSDVASWIRADHKTPALLAKHFYTEPLEEYNGWKLVNRQKRIGVYANDGAYIVVFRGTQDAQDVADDVSIAGIKSLPVTLIREGRAILSQLKSKNITLTGHSLGGYAAQSLAEDFKLKCVVFNPAAPASSPPKIGSGKGNSFVYHIVGDLISTHTDPNKNTVMRVDYGYDYSNTLKAHSMNMFMQQPGVLPKGSMTAEQEDIKYNLFTSAGVAQGSAYFSALNVPIPGSLREEDPRQGTVQKLNSKFDIDNFVSTVGQPVANMLMQTPTQVDTPLLEFKKAYNSVKVLAERSRKFKDTQLSRLPTATKLKMVNDTLGLVSATKIPETVVMANIPSLYSIVQNVSDKPIPMDVLATRLMMPPIDLTREDNVNMLDIDPVNGSGEIAEMFEDVDLPLGKRLEQLKAIAVNYDNYGTFNREEILEKMRVDPSAKPWTRIPIFEGQTDINIYAGQGEGS
jgi:hypothetical protein